MVSSSPADIVATRDARKRVTFKRPRAGIFGPIALFLNAPETFRARRAIFSSSVSKTRELYVPKTSCMKGTFVQMKNM